MNNAYESSDSSHDSLSGEFEDQQWVGPNPAHAASLSTGDLLGKCRIIREIGIGGMGTVYLAEHTRLQIEVALKVLPPALVRDRPRLAQRFLREAQLAARIRHPNVVAVMDADIDETTGLYYMIMEYLPGGSLAQRLKHGPLAPEEAIRLMRDIAEGLSSAAEHGVIHRDVKPGNILLDAKGRGHLGDLGLARQDDPEMARVTVDGSALGTPTYMSPDQVKDAQTADAQDDIYSLGATFYECLTGQPPFSASNPFAIIAHILSDPIPDPRKKRPELSPSIAAVCLKMMAKNKEERYRTAREVALALHALQENRYIGPTPNPPSRLREALQAIAILLLTGLAIRFYFWNPVKMLTHDLSPQTVTYTNTAAPVDPVPATTATDEEAIVANPVTSPTPEIPVPQPPQSINTDSTPGETPEPFPVDPVVEAKGDTLSAFQAQRQAESSVVESARGNLLQIIGYRRHESPAPIVWKILFYDATASKNVRTVTMTGHLISEIRQGFVDMKKFRIVAFKPEEVIHQDQLLIDSTELLTRIQQIPEMNSVWITSSSLFLERDKELQAPVWKATLYTQKQDETVLLGDIKIRADTGDVIENRLKPDRAK